jgi:hypothetical protein
MPSASLRCFSSMRHYPRDTSTADLSFVLFPSLKQYSYPLCIPVVSLSRIVKAAFGFYAPKLHSSNPHQHMRLQSRGRCTDNQILRENQSPLFRRRYWHP